MATSPIESHELATDTGWARTIAKGATLRLTAKTGVSLVAFNAHDLTERFDQARTKVYNMKLWLEPGDKLFSKLNNPMMTVRSDGFAPRGRHDLQLGMCTAQSSSRHGCLENLTAALTPWAIAAHHVPMPLNAFQHAQIDTKSGLIRRTTVRPDVPVALELVADMDLVVAAAACPDPDAPGTGSSVLIEVLSP